MSGWDHYIKRKKRARNHFDRHKQGTWQATNKAKNEPLENGHAHVVSWKFVHFVHVIHYGDCPT